jgi:hypothetical protein
VWELLHDGLTCEQIADRLAAEFEVDHDRAASTVLELVSDLRREGLLRP